MKLEEVHLDIHDYIHQPFNIYAESGKGHPYLYATWFLYDEPDMDEILEEAGESLAEMFEKFDLEPVRVKAHSRIFLARFEFPIYLEGFRYPDGALEESAIGFIDFLSGFPFHCIETIGYIGEWSDDTEEVSTEERTWEPIPFSPKCQFFDGFKRFLVNFTGASSVRYGCVAMADNLAGTQKPQNLHFWLRVNVDASLPFPIPGEFVGMCCRIFPNLPWGEQHSHPFLFSGNWLDTAFYSSGKLLGALGATDERPYGLHVVQRRGEMVEGVIPTDFAVHTMGDRITILKNPAPSVTSMTWEDDKEFNASWRIAPVLFYGR